MLQEVLFFPAMKPDDPQKKQEQQQKAEETQ